MGVLAFLLFAGPIVCLSGRTADGAGSGDGQLAGGGSDTAGLTGNQARVEVAVYNTNGSGRGVNGEYYTSKHQLTGNFSPAGVKGSAEGEIKQMHPLALCNSHKHEEPYAAGYVCVVQLVSPLEDLKPCLTVYQKAKLAVQLGATAVIFDVTHNADAVEELRRDSTTTLNKPIVTLHGSHALQLMNIVNRQKEARARITHVPPDHTQQKTSNEFFDMGIFVAFFVLIAIVCLLLLLKLRWRQKRKQTSQVRMAMDALAKMEVRKYKRYPDHVNHHHHHVAHHKLRKSSHDDRYAEVPHGPAQRVPPQEDRWAQAATLSIASEGTICAICLEEFREGEEVRVVPCSHEFHRHCVDPWLLSNRTCPLCMYNIIGCGPEPSQPRLILPPNSTAMATTATMPSAQQPLRVSLPASPVSPEVLPESWSFPPTTYRIPYTGVRTHSFGFQGCPRRGISQCKRGLPHRASVDHQALGSMLRELPCLVESARRAAGSRTSDSADGSRGVVAMQQQQRGCDKCGNICSNCQRQMGGEGATSRDGCHRHDARVESRRPGLTSFENHYFVNLSPVDGWGESGNYHDLCSLRCPGKRLAGGHGSRHYCGQIVPVRVHLENLPPPAAPASPEGLGEDPVTSSGSSLSLSAFHADCECSDSTVSSHGNFDSNQSMYGSSSTFRSDPSTSDPCAFAKPGHAQQQQQQRFDPAAATQLTPTCVHRINQVSAPLATTTSDTDEAKHSSDTAKSAASNLSMQVNVSQKSALPTVSNTTRQPSGHHHRPAAKPSSHNRCSHSHANYRGHQPHRTRDSRKANSKAPQLLWTPPSTSSQSTAKHKSPCPCCSGKIVWESCGVRGTDGAAKPVEERSKPQDRGSRYNRKQGRGSLRDMCKGHLRLPLQSLAALQNDQGAVVTLPIHHDNQKVLEEIV